MNNQLGNHNPGVTNNNVLTNKVIPQKLKDRLGSRKKARILFIVQSVYNFLLLALGVLFFDCYYYTRNYIFDGDAFWAFYQSHNLKNKEIPLNCMLCGIISVMTFSFNCMNLLVIGLYIIFGGVRLRIVFASNELYNNNRLREYCPPVFIFTFQHHPNRGVHCFD